MSTDTLTRWDAEALTELEQAVFLAARPDDQLLECRVALSPHAWLVRETDLGTGSEQLRIRFEGGRAQTQELSEASLVLVDSLLRADTVRDALESFAAAAEAEPAEVQPQVVQFVRQSLVAGLLVPK